MARSRVITMTGYFLPGFKGGGPIRTLVNLADRLGSEFDFLFVTNDRDLGDLHPYTGVPIGQWHSDKYMVYYLPRNRRVRAVLGLLWRGNEYDAVYLNSFFSSVFTVIPLTMRRIGLTRAVPFIVAPRGELFAGALSIKPFKKKLFIQVAKALGLYRNVIWQASSDDEANVIRSTFGPNAKVAVAPDLLPATASEYVKTQSKQCGRLKLLFLSRIARVKNLDGALQMLFGLSGDLEFNIYGPIEEHEYWQECVGLINQLPPNVRVTYRGAVQHDQVPTIMADHDALLLPTRGENFGHVIPESLVSGTPVLISDRTPWADLQENKAGWVISLDRPEEFHCVVQRLVDMDQQEHQSWSLGARVLGLAHLEDEASVRQNRTLFGSISTQLKPR